jgi:hypothetical protein
MNAIKKEELLLILYDAIAETLIQKKRLSNNWIAFFYIS